MRLRSICFLVLLLGWLSGGLTAQVYAPEQVPNVYAQDSLQLLSDPAGYISSGERAQLNASLTQLRLRYGVEYAVVVLPSVGERPIEEYATALFRHWGIGSKEKDAGLLLLIAVEQRQMRFETGYGLEGVLPDALLGRVQRQQMRPHMQSGHYAQAIAASISAVDQALAQEGYASGRTTARREVEGDSIWLLLKVLYGVILVASTYSAFSALREAKWRAHRSSTWLRTKLPSLSRQVVRSSLLLLLLCLPVGLVYLWYSRRCLAELVKLGTRCPRCGAGSLLAVATGEHLRYLSALARLEEQLGSRRYQVYLCGSCAYQETSSEDLGSHWYVCARCGGRTSEVVSRQRVTIRGRGQYIRMHLRCRSCSHQEDHDQRDSSGEDLALNSLLLAGLLGGGRHRGGGFGGGGFGGGSFGGGSSGGGGATGRW